MYIYIFYHNTVIYPGATCVMMLSGVIFSISKFRVLYSILSKTCKYFMKREKNKMYNIHKIQFQMSKHVHAIYVLASPKGDEQLPQPTSPSLSPSELQLLRRPLCLMGVVPGSSTPEKSAGPGASSIHFPFS